MQIRIKKILKKYYLIFQKIVKFLIYLMPNAKFQMQDHTSYVQRMLS